MTPLDPLAGFSPDQAIELADRLNAMSAAAQADDLAAAHEVDETRAAEQAQDGGLTEEQYKKDVAIMSDRLKGVENPVAFLRALKEDPKVGEGVNPRSRELFFQSAEKNVLPTIQKIFKIDDEGAARQKLYTDPGALDYGGELVRSFGPMTMETLDAQASGVFRVLGTSEWLNLKSYFGKKFGLESEEQIMAKMRELNDAREARWAKAQKDGMWAQASFSTSEDEDLARRGLGARSQIHTADQIDKGREQRREENPDDPRIASTKAGAFIEGMAQMPANLITAPFLGVREIANYGQLYDEAFQQAKQVGKQQGREVTDEEAHSAATTAALINLPLEEVSDLVLAKGFGKLLPKKVADKINKFAKANPKLSWVGGLTAKALTEGLTELGQGTVTNTTTGAPLGYQAEGNFFGGLGGGAFAHVVMDGGAHLLDRATNGKEAAGEAAAPPTTNANGTVIDVDATVQPNTGTQEAGIVQQVTQAFAAIDGNDQFNDEQKSKAKESILGSLTPEERTAVEEGLKAARPNPTPADKVLAMVAIQHTTGLTADQKTEQQRAIIDSMPESERAGVQQLFDAAHSNAAKLAELRRVAPATAAALEPELNAQLDGIMANLDGLTPKERQERETLSQLSPAEKDARVQTNLSRNTQLTEGERQQRDLLAQLSPGERAALLEHRFQQQQQNATQLTENERRQRDLLAQLSPGERAALLEHRFQEQQATPNDEESTKQEQPQTQQPEAPVVSQPETTPEAPVAQAETTPVDGVAKVGDTVELPSLSGETTSKAKITAINGGAFSYTTENGATGTRMLASLGLRTEEAPVAETPAPQPAPQPKAKTITPAAPVEATSDELAPASPEDVAAEEALAPDVRDEGKVWKEATLVAFANPKVLANYYRSTGMSSEAAARKVQGIMKEREAQGRTLTTEDDFNPQRVASIYSAAVSSSRSGGGVNTEKLAHLLDKVRDHLTRNAEETGNPETRHKKTTGEMTRVAFKGPKGLISRDAQNYNKNMATGGTKVSLDVLDGPVREDSGDAGVFGDSPTQVQGNEVEQNPTVRAEDQTRVAPGAATAAYHSNPRQAMMARERADMRQRLHEALNSRIREFIRNLSSSDRFGKEEDIERATMKLAAEAFGTKLVDLPTDKNGRVKGGRLNEETHALLENDEFLDAVEDMKGDIAEMIVREFGEARPSLNDSAVKSNLTAEEVADSLREAVDGMGDLGASVQVVQSEADLPPHTRLSVERNGQTGRVRGIYDAATGDIYVVAEAHADVNDAARTLLHEAVGEHGLDQVLPSQDWNSIRDAVLADPETASVSDTYKGKEVSQLDETEKDIVAREALAKMAEDPSFKPTLWSKIVAAVNAGLRKLGFNVAYGDAELRQLVQAARDQVAGQETELARPDNVDPTKMLAFIKQTTGRDLIAESLDRTKLEAFAKEYSTEQGVDALMKAVAAKESDPVLKGLAQALIGRAPRNTRITLNPELALRNLAGRALPRQGRIELDPSRGGRGLHRTALEETLHMALFDKIKKFNEADFKSLSKEDVENLSALASLYEEVLLGHAPREIQILVTDYTLNNAARNEAFRRLAQRKPELGKWYHAVSMDEFVAGALVDSGFQTLLKGIARVDGADNTVRKAKKGTVWSKLRDLFVKLVMGGRTNSALYQTVDNALSIIERNDNQADAQGGSEIVTETDPELGSLITGIQNLWNDRDAIAKSAIRLVGDRLNDLRDLEKLMADRRGLGTLPDNEAAHLASENYHGKVPFRLEQLEQTHVAAIRTAMDELKAAGGSLVEANDWLYAKHARERNIHIASINSKFPDSGSGMSNADAATKIANYLASPMGAALQKLSAAVQTMNVEALKNMLDGGLITQDQFNNIAAKYSNYVTLQGFEGQVQDEDDSILPHLGKGFDIRGAEPKRALGRASKATDVLQNSIEQAARVIIRQEKNHVLQRLGELVRNNPDPAIWEFAQPETKPFYDKRTNKVVDRGTHSYRMRDDIIAYKEKGELRFLNIKLDSLRKNIKNAGLANTSLVEKIFYGGIGALNRFKAAFVTTYSPDFMLTNLLRDMQTATMNLTGPELEQVKGAVAKDLIQFKALRAAYQAIKKGNLSDPYAKSFREMEEAGGRISFYGLNDVQQHIKNAVGALNEGLIKKALNKTGFTALGEVFQSYGSVIENSTRLAVYHNLRLKGVSVDRAAHAARNITVNFNRKGELGSFMNTLFLFSNASIQSTFRMVEALKSRGGWKKVGAFALRGVLLGAALGMLNRWLGDDDDKDGLNHYDKIPDFVRHTNLILMVPKWLRESVKDIPGVRSVLGEEGRYLKFPMPYGYNVFVSTGTTLEKFAAGKMTAAHAVGDLFGSANDVFNPLGGAGNLLQQVTPTFARPVTDLMLNKNFAGNPVYPNDMPFKAPVPDSEKYFRSVSPVSKAATKAINEFFGGNEFHSGSLGPIDMSISPATVDYMMGYAFGAVGDTFNRLAKNGVKIVTGDFGNIEANDIPVFRRFVGGESDMATRTAFTYISNAAKTAKDEIDTMVVRQDSKRALDAARKQVAELGVFQELQKTNAQRTKLAQLRQKIDDDTKLSAAVKSAALDRVNDADLALQKELVRKYVAIKKARNEVVDLSAD